jgi:hypothetical protein
MPICRLSAGTGSHLIDIDRIRITIAEVAGSAGQTSLLKKGGIMLDKDKIDELEKKIKEMRDNNAFYQEAGSMAHDAKVFLRNHKLGTVVFFMLIIGFMIIASWL